MDAVDARMEMIRSQIAARGVRSPRVLAALASVPRESFVLAEDRERAFDDAPLPIGYGATISQPYIVALMTEVLDPEEGERILEIGTGSGYQSAILAALGARVCSVEIVPELSARAGRILEELGHDVRLRVGDGREGWPEEAPFDGILVAAAPGEIPPALVEQLRIGGRLVLPLGIHRQDLVLARRTPGGLTRRTLTAVRFVPLLSEAP